MVEFKEETSITVRSFHYDLNEEAKSKNEINVSLRLVEPKNKEKYNLDKDSFFEVAVIFDIAPEPGRFSVSGLISQIIRFKDYQGEGKDLSSDEYQSLTKPLVKYIKTLTYQVTKIILDEPVDLNFEANF